MRALTSLVMCFVAITLNACIGAPTKASEQAVRGVWEEYLTSKQGQFAANAGTPSPLWSASEQTQWPMYDLAGFYIPDQAVPDVVSITPVNTDVDSAYQIVTRFWPSTSAPRDSAAHAMLTMTVYAHRERDGWMLVNALPYRTHRWYRATRGRIHYRIAPALRFDTAKAARAARFVDSLSAVFGLTPPPRIDYYVTESVDQAMEILGAVVPQRFGAAGGFAKPVNFQVFSGIPAQGENYRHELAHVILLPIIRGGLTSLLASEGVPTWLGGTAGRDYEGSVQYLAEQLRMQPTLTLDTIISNTSVSADVRNAAGAVLAHMVHDAGGAEAVRMYLQTPSTPRLMRESLQRLLDQPWEGVVADWHRRVGAYRRQ